MAEVHASAPGKAMLLGEYAVLSGAEGLVMAVDRRARVSVVPEVGPCRISAPELSLDGAVLAEDSDARLTLLRTVVRWAAPRLQDVHLHIDTRAFLTSDGAHKLGLGSSAAVAAATALGLLVYAGEPVPAPVALAAAVATCHREAQGGRGSGLDVVASVAGAVHGVTVTPDGFELRGPAVSPSGFHLVAVWSGASARTAPRLAALAAAQRLPGDPTRAPLRTIAGAAAQGTTAFLASDFVGFAAATRETVAGLTALAAAMGTTWLTEAHAMAADLASQHGGVYKPSGAGGGDLGVAWFPGAHAARAFADDVSATPPLEEIPLSVAVEGARIDRGA